MNHLKSSLSKKTIQREIYKTFAVLSKSKTLQIEDFLQKLDVSVFQTTEYRSIKYSHSSLLKTYLLQRLKKLRFQTRVVRYLKSHPESLSKLGLSEAPDQTTLSYFINHILTEEVHDYLDYAIDLIWQVSEKYGIVFDEELIDGPTDKPKKPKERNLYLLKQKKTSEVCKLFKRRFSPFIEMHIKRNGRYSKDDFLNLLVHLGLTQDFAENGAHILKEYRDTPVPDGDTLLRHLKMYDDLPSIRRMFRDVFDVLWNMVQSSGMIDVRKPVDVAIDYTEWFYYGKCEKAHYVTSKRPERGTQHCYKFATISIVDCGRRFTLYAVPVTKLQKKERILTELLEYAKKRIRIRTLYVDRGFFDSASIKTFNRHNIQFLMPAIKNYSVRRLLELLPAPFIVKNFYLRHTRMTLFVLEYMGEKHAFATNIPMHEEDIVMAGHLSNLYSKRWGIETSYRVKKHTFRGKTTSKNYKIRLFYFLFSVLLYNLWIFADILIWRHVYNTVGEDHLITSKYFGTIFMNTIGEW